MANKTITDLTAGTAPDGTELIHGVQGGNSRKFTVDQINVAGLLDEDNFASDSASKAPSQQSAKAYIDGHGVVQQVYSQTGAVATGAATIPLDDTIPQNTEGTEFMTLTITPKNAANILRIEVNANVFISTTAYVEGALFQDANASALASVIDYTAATATIKLVHSMVAGTTSATTFKFRAGASAAATMTFNGISGNRQHGGRMASSIIITELKA